MTLGDNKFLFRMIQKTKNGERLRDSGHISYSYLRIVCILKKKIADLGFPAQEFGLHSLRSGGATAAANADVPDRIFKRHAWKVEE